LAIFATSHPFTDSWTRRDDLAIFLGTGSY
jgi:hypothetical protein